MFPNREHEPEIKLATANSYREAMHKMCIDCHKTKKSETGKEKLDNCGTCHQSLNVQEIIHEELPSSNDDESNFAFKD